METMHFYIVHTKIILRRTSFPTEQLGMNLKGHRSAGYFVP